MNRRGRGKPWTPEQTKLLRKLYPVTPNHIIAERIGKSSHAVKTRATLLKITKTVYYNPNAWTSKEDKYLKDNYTKYTYPVLAQKMGKTESAINNHLRKLKLYLPAEIIASRKDISRFKKGHVSFNKGKTWDDFMPKESQAASRKTTFKKVQRRVIHFITVA